MSRRPTRSMLRLRKWPRRVLAFLLTLLLIFAWQMAEGRSGLAQSSGVDSQSEVTSADEQALEEADQLFYAAMDQFKNYQYEAALQLYQQALAVYREIEDELGQAVSLSGIAATYNFLGQSSQTLEMYQQALPFFRIASVRQAYPKASYIGELAALRGMAEACMSLEQYSQALNYYQQSLNLLREPNNSLSAQDVSLEIQEIFNAIGIIHLEQRQYSQALQQFQQALEIARGLEDRGAEAEILNSLSALYIYQGQYFEALEQAQQVLQISGEIHDSSLEATVLINIGVIYNQVGQESRAIEYLNQALEISRSSSFQSTFLSLAPDLERAALIGIGEIYLNLGEYSRALEQFQQALEIARDDHLLRSEGLILNNIGLTYVFLKNYQLASEHYQQALVKRREASDRRGEEQTLHNMSTLYWAQGDLASALTAFKLVGELEEESLATVLSTSSEERKLAYASTFSARTNSVVSFHIQAAFTDVGAARLALTMMLQRKGRVLDAVTDDLQVLRQNLTSQDQLLLDQLQAVRAQLASLMYGELESRSLEQSRSQINDLQTQAEHLENQLAQRSAEFRTDAEPVTIESIQALIPDDSALVELVQYKPFYPRAAAPDRWGSPRYAAYVLHKTGDPQAVDLGEAEPIDQAITNFRETLRSTESGNRVYQSARSLDALVMQPIRSLLSDKMHILISPDGQLNLIPFAALRDENDRYLLESYDFTYLTSGRDLLKLQLEAPSREAPVLFANPDYDDPGSSQIAAIATAQPAPTSDRGSPQRSSDIATLRFSPLEGTQQEADAIAPLLPNATILTGRNATENTLKRLQAPSILHLATHGFFLEDVEFVPPTDSRGSVSVEMSAIDRPPAAPNVRQSNENPLLRSGLALAGFNPRQSGSEDGVLTALEVTNLDLRGTQLVVMSACETGLGDVINGEGVYGLRRAFVMAGAESQLMSLWKVDDYETSVLMADYYKRIRAGAGRSEAFRQAQLATLAAPASAHPYYWAAFIFSGNWRTIEDL